MRGTTDKLENEIDRIYGLPLDEFTPARDALAKRLRAEGDRDGAAEIKRLRKPTLPAWALNQVLRHEPRAVAELIDAGERLQDAQQRLVAGGERGLLRDAAANERQSVEQVVGLGEQELAGAGHPVGPAVQSKLWATVHAAAVNPEARELLRAGRLIRDYEVSDLGLGGAGAAVAPRTEPERAGRPAPSPRAVPAGRAGREDPGARDRKASERAAAAARKEAARKEAARKAKVVRRQLDRARTQHEAAAQRVKDARKRVSDARREAARAASELERSEAAADQAGERAQATRGRVDELETALRELDA